MPLNLEQTQRENRRILDRSKGREDAPARFALVVEDNEGLRDLLARALELVGFEVKKAENGRTAYDFFLESRYDLVVTDLHMPVMNGFALINRIKTRSPDVPIILVSGHLLDDLSEIGGPSAVATVMKKPFQLSELQKTALRVVAS
ncbi:MAG: response regulator [Desulfobacterales bacterium]